MSNVDELLKLSKKCKLAITRGGINLAQNLPVICDDDPERALKHVGMEVTEGNLDHYFPKNEDGERCPTITFMEIWCRSDVSARSAPFTPGLNGVKHPT